MPTKTFFNTQRMHKIGVKYRRQLRKKPTKAETEFRKLLSQYNIHHQFQRLVYTPRRFFILDFVIKMKPFVIVEIDGHSHYGKDCYDVERTRLVLEHRLYKKYQVIRFTNEEVFNGSALVKLKQLYPKRF